MARLICMANSWRDGGRCLAAIDTASKQWVRPVPAGGGAIPEEKTFLDGKFIAPLDIVDIELDEPTFTTRFQCENRQVRNWNWRRAGRATFRDVMLYCSKSRYVLHNRVKIVDPSYLENFPPSKWASLQLIHVKNAFFQPNPRKPKRWQAVFSLGLFGAKYCLTVTDPETTQLLNQGGEIRPECLLTISLTEPIEFKQYDKPPLCYKLVAGVIEL
ncbi:MAG: dual OB domain-containing protein [Thermoguttaceae bacterium]